MDIHNLKVMLVKEFRQIRRDPRTLGLLIGMPVMMLTMFGWAVSREIRHLPLGVVDQDRSRLSREYIRSFTAPGSYDLVLEADSAQEITRALDRGEIHAGLIIEPDFSKNIMRGQSGNVEGLIDGTDPQVAITALGNAKLVTFAHSLELLDERLKRTPPPIRLPVDKPAAIARYWYNPDLRKINFYVPSLIGLIITQVTLILTSLAIVREKEQGSMELLLSSPLTPIELILGKILPYLILAFLDVNIVLLVAVVVFQVTVSGSIVLFYFLSLLYVFTSLSVGLSFSSLANNQQQALYIIMFYMIFSFLLSGFIFPIVTMPKVLQYLTYMIPLRYFLAIIRGILTKGVGLGVLLPEVCGLSALGLIAVTLSSMTFKRTLD